MATGVKKMPRSSDSVEAMNKSIVRKSDQEPSPFPSLPPKPKGPIHHSSLRVPCLRLREHASDCTCSETVFAKTQAWYPTTGMQRLISETATPSETASTSLEDRGKEALPQPPARYIARLGAGVGRRKWAHFHGFYQIMLDGETVANVLIGKHGSIQIAHD